MNICVLEFYFWNLDFFDLDQAFFFLIFPSCLFVPVNLETVTRGLTFGSSDDSSVLKGLVFTEERWKMALGVGPEYKVESRDRRAKEDTQDGPKTKNLEGGEHKK